jgi:site-specific DNA recombinase
MKWAHENGVEVEKRHIFTDEAITGRSRRRQGLQDLKAAVEAGEIDVVIIFHTSRLFRKMHRTLQFVDEELVGRGIRCVFVSQGIDTANKADWEQQLQFAAMLDQFAGRANVQHIRASHMGQLVQGLILGTVPLGYTGQPIEGQTTRRGLPKRKIVPDTVAARWVRHVFDWYAQEGLSISGIVRRLNSEGAPLSPNAQGGRWTYHTVRRVLSNRRYVGIWSYGERENHWISSKDYSRGVLRDEPLQTVRHEELRLIDDVTWEKAQARLAGNHREGGRKPKAGQHTPYPRLLNGLLYCSVHNRPITTRGTRGRYMSCPACKDQSRPALFSMVDRRLATDLICGKIIEILLGASELVDKAVDICEACVEADERPDPGEIERLQRKHHRLSERVSYVMDMPAETNEDKAENRAKVQALRAERAEIQMLIAELEEALRRPTVVPDRDDVRQRLDQFARCCALLLSPAIPRSSIRPANC